MNFEEDLLKIENTLKPKKGRMLISEPFSQDTFFKRSIVFLTGYNKEGATGFILNRPLKMKIEEIVSDFPNFESVVSIGGPVGTDSVFFIHTLGEKIPGSMHITKDYYWGGDLEILKQYVQKKTIKPNQVRFFVGYSGWQAKQLETEISNNFWIVSNRIPENIMTSSDVKSWKRVIEQLGEKYKVWVNTPDNPIFN